MARVDEDTVAQHLGVSLTTIYLDFRQIGG